MPCHATRLRLNPPTGPAKKCVAQFLNQYYSPDDLSEFWKLFGSKFAHRQGVDKVVGPDLKIAGTEASLDTEVSRVNFPSARARAAPCGTLLLVHLCDLVHHVVRRQHFHVVLVDCWVRDQPRARCSRCSGR